MDGLPKVSNMKHIYDFDLPPLNSAVSKNVSALGLSLQSSPNNMGGMNNPPGTPRDDGEMGGNFLNPFQSESVSRVSEWHLMTLNNYP